MPKLRGGTIDLQADANGVPFLSRRQAARPGANRHIKAPRRELLRVVLYRSSNGFDRHAITGADSK